MNLCHCGSALPFESCCQPFHLGEAFATTPEQLMRSRYSAFVTAKASYLLSTHDPDTRQGLTEQALKQSCEESDFIGLQILDAPPFQQDEGEVEFRAWYRQGKEILALWERSQFRRIDSRWYYHSGDVRSPVKLGRNDPCPCGSEKKAKKCCL